MLSPHSAVTQGLPDDAPECPGLVPAEFCTTGTKRCDLGAHLAGDREG